ncbi:hypothetical protein HK098_002980 [Nowakowskiella sp. JEL0407]|nr:hypothetical protein HK098_002980 [Nowakowskiella sp. JEL0407]
MTVTCSQFYSVDWKSNSSSERVKEVLLIGTTDGLHIWNITDSNNFRQIAVVGEVIDGSVIDISLLQHGGDAENAKGPKIALLVRKNRTDRIVVFSLNKHEIIDSLSLEETQVCSMKSYGLWIGVLFSNGELKLFSHSLRHHITYDNVVGSDISQNIFDIGPRLIIFATSLTLPSNAYTDDFSSRVAKTSTTTEVSKAAGLVAKELVDGMKTVGGIGYTAFSNYLSKSSDKNELLSEQLSPPVASILQVKREVDGLVMICELPQLQNDDKKLPTHFDPSQAIAHWKAHNNQISYLKFNPNHTLLISASSQAFAFLVWVIPSTANKDAPHCIYRLERGLTPAFINNITFSLDSKWIGVSTARGTTHIFQIHPLKGTTSTGRQKAKKILAMAKLKHKNTMAIEFLRGNSFTGVKKENSTCLFRQKLLAINISGLLTLHSIDITLVEPPNSNSENITRNLLSKYSSNVILASQYPALAGASPNTPFSEKVAQYVKISSSDLLEWSLLTSQFLNANAKEFVWEYNATTSTPKTSEKKGSKSVSAPETNRWISEIELHTFDLSTWRPLVGFVFESYVLDDNKTSGEKNKMNEETSTPRPDYSDLPKTKVIQSNIQALDLVPQDRDNTKQNIATAMDSRMEFDELLLAAQKKTLSFEDAFYIEELDLYPHHPSNLNYKDDTSSISGSTNLFVPSTSSSPSPNSFTNAWKKLFDGKPVKKTNENFDYSEPQYGPAYSDLESLSSNPNSPPRSAARPVNSKPVSDSGQVSANLDASDIQFPVSPSINGKSLTTINSDERNSTGVFDFDDFEEDNGIGDQEDSIENKSEEILSEEEDPGGNGDEGSEWLGGFLDYRRNQHTQMLQQQLQLHIAAAMMEETLPDKRGQVEWERKSEFEADLKGSKNKID